MIETAEMHPSVDRERTEEAIGHPIRFRAVALGFLFLPVNAYWSAECVPDTIFSLIVPPVATLMVLALLNALLRKLTRRWFFHTPDLVVFFSILFVGCAIASEWMWAITPYWHSFGLYAERNNAYKQHILPYLPDWLFFKSGEQLQDYAVGGYDYRRTLSRLPLWLPLILSWTTLLTLTTLSMLCINTLMRGLWTRRERLAFPILQVPLLLCQPQSPLWRSRYLWGAFILMGFIDIINALNYFYPSIPLIKVRFLARLNDYLTTPPWNQVGWIPVGVFPFMAAIGVFVPNDLLFSCIFFYFVRKIMQVITAALGYEQGVFGGSYLVPEPPYFSEQSWGAFLGLFVSVVWASRAYLKELWQEIKTGRTADGERVVPTRWAFAGLLLSLLGLVLFGTATGLPWWLVAIYLLLYMAFSVVVTRLRAQLGAPIHEMAFMGPHQLIIAFTGTQSLSEPTMVRIMSILHFMNRIHRTHPMPFQLEAIKLGELTRLNQRGLFLVILGALIVGAISGEIAYVNRNYKDGAGDWGGGMAWVMTQLSQHRYPPNLTAIAFFTGAFCFVLLLDFIRYRLPGFPVHPAGYALAMNFGVDYIWFGLMIVLSIKIFIQRYFGLPGYEKLRAVALGIILAEFAVELPLAWYHIVTGKATYTISINGHLGWDQ